jgi:hypothetical protein
LAYQRRPLSDVLFKWAIHNLRSINGDFWFVLSIRSSEKPFLADDLEGKIYIYKSKDDWRSKGEDVVRGAINNINDWRFLPDQDKEQVIVEEFITATSVLDQTADISLTFKLHRTGEVIFSRPAYQDPDLKYASEDFAMKCGHDFSKWVADQAYFFLRDASHSHQHHHPASDTILILQERDPEDIQWRKKIIYSLYYAIIRAKRSGHALSVYQSTGVQAYCMSFKGICEERIGSDAVEKFPQFNDDALRQSLESKAQELMAGASMAFSRSANLRTFILALAAIFIATLAILVQPRIGNLDDRRAFPGLHLASDLASEHFFPIVFVCVMSIAIVWLVTRSGWLLLHFPTGRDLLELSNVRRSRFIIGSLLVALTVFTITLYATWDAVRQLWNSFVELVPLIL